MTARIIYFLGIAFGLGVACSASNDDRTFPDNDGGEGGSGATSGSTGAGIGGSFTVGSGGGGGFSGDICKVSETNENALPDCVEKAPPDSFTPVVQWEWTAPPADPTSVFSGSFMTPLVGNFTDDNSDGAVDLCDIPDVLIMSIETFQFGGLAVTSTSGMYLLSGDNGALKVTFNGKVDSFVQPAFGDIDNDGLPEVVAGDSSGRLVAFEHDGTQKWFGDPALYTQSFSSAQCVTVALYDLEGDGSVEILAGFEVFNAEGKKLWGVPGNASQWDNQYWCTTPTAADLDGDGKLEVLFGHTTYRYDGTLFWEIPNFAVAHPQVANLDADPEPEVFLTNKDGITIVEANGTIKFGPVRPTDPTPNPNCWGKPAVVHDFDGDGVADIATGTCSDYTAYTVNPGGVTPKWSQPVQDFSGLATATAFDFLGDGVADGIYADETQIYVFDGALGDILMTAPRTSGTLIEYPVVADIDNDGSAEIAYVSNYQQGQSGPALTVLRDEQDRWIQSRRIWNQYQYHVTNVREDGTIPKVMKKSWQLLNTFRTNSQIEGGGDCNPPEPPK
ncbi:MAG: VCBS repeat-containing protein [Polyangiaceae bacterium]|nr:VCBS repeat-containing protein [Polyangiaceae bacterium]